jgi:PST family polysaccharide transporter
MVSLLLFLYGREVLIFLYDEKFITEEVLYIFKILSFLPVIYGVVHIFCTQMLLINKAYKTYKRILFSGFLINLILGFSLIKEYAAVGASFLIIITELFIMLFSLYAIRNLQKSLKG